MVSSIVGRWLATTEESESGSGGMVIIEGNGSVRIPGEPDEMQVSSDETAGPGNFRLEIGSGTAAESFNLRLTNKVSEQGVHEELIEVLSPENEVVETWHRTVDTCGTPKVVSRKKGDLMRRWTREDQAGSPKAAQTRKCFHRDDVPQEADEDRAKLEPAQTEEEQKS
mmetsp:Transcript_65163/g.136514  ORF Transcript_65163/g.136514 Transcript_65163/m.136514 type:complete len:168 (+) Transcript_65163:418-921(+)